MSRGRCRSCGAEVIWTVTAKGKRMPVDPLPTAAGRITLEPTTTSGPFPRDELRATVVPGTGPLPDGIGYVSHFSSCPHAAGHRRR